jgi:hypothetical protein
MLPSTAQLGAAIAALIVILIFVSLPRLLLHTHT